MPLDVLMYTPPPPSPTTPTHHPVWVVAFTAYPVCVSLRPRSYPLLLYHAEATAATSHCQQCHNDGTVTTVTLNHDHPDCPSCWTNIARLQKQLRYYPCICTRGTAFYKVHFAETASKDAYVCCHFCRLAEACSALLPTCLEHAPSCAHVCSLLALHPHCFMYNHTGSRSSARTVYSHRSHWQ